MEKRVERTSKESDLDKLLRNKNYSYLFDEDVAKARQNTFGGI